MKRWLLGLIILIGFLLRVVSLQNYPIGFTPDEASFGYDAYSILKTGRDQWGKPFPLVLESFGDFKSPLYAYLTIPSVALLGLTKFSVRLPSAIIGTLAILATYLLASKFFGKKVGLFSSFLLAISPWHIMLSRGAFEANLTTFFLPFGMYLISTKKYTLGALMLGLNLFSYHTAKFVTPAVLTVYVIMFGRELIADLKSRKVDAMVGFLTFMLFIGLTGYTFFMGAGARVAERSITSGALEAAFADKVLLAETIGDFGARIIHNKYTVVAERFMENYFSYFSPQFLFTAGAREGTYGMIPGVGVLYLFVLPFVVGVRKVFFEKSSSSKLLVFLAIWVAVSVVPASLATGVGLSANRVAAMMPAIDIILGVGGYYLFDLIKKKKFAVYGYSALMAISFVLFVVQYFAESPYKIAKDMLYGNLEVAEVVTDNVGDREVIVDKSLSEPHIYFAFASKMDPSAYQEATKSWNYRDIGVLWIDQMPEYKLGNITFKDLDGADGKSSSILVGRESDFTFEFNSTNEITIGYPSGETAVKVVGI